MRMRATVVALLLLVIASASSAQGYKAMMRQAESKIAAVRCRHPRHRSVHGSMVQEDPQNDPGGGADLRHATGKSGIATGLCGEGNNLAPHSGQL